MSCNALSWAWRQPVSPRAKLTLIAMSDGIESFDNIVHQTGLSSTEVLDAFSEIGKLMLVIWRGRRPYFRLGEFFQDNNGRMLDEG